MAMRLRRAWSVTTALGLIAVGCRAYLVPPPVEPPSQPEAPPPGCDELGPVLLSVEPSPLSLTCENGHRDCSGRATLSVHSCAATAIEVHEVLLSPAPPLRPPVVSVGGTVRIEPGATWTMELELEERGVYELSLGPIARRPGDPEIRLGTTTLTVDNPAREQAIAACRECNGDWSRHGIFSTEGCVCRTGDGGTPCDDGADCKGHCMARQPESGFRCSEFTTEWGCYSYLPEGWSKERHPEGTVEPYVCVD